MKFNTDTMPPVFLSGARDSWTIIVQGLPICDTKKTAAEALEVAKLFKVQPHSSYWDIDEQAYILRSDVDHLQADEAAAFTLTHPKPPGRKDSTLNLF